MLAPAALPFRYQLFNWRWGAPRGRVIRGALAHAKRATQLGAALVGPFGFQTNNTTRAFEYPWAFEALRAEPGQRVLEIGGGLSGFQFVLDKAGCEVVNADPGDSFHTTGWPVTPATMQRLNSAVGTDVTLLNSYVEDAHFPADHFDRVVSVSVFEHVPEEALAPLLREVHRILKPGGLMVATVDLFLDVEPFTSARENVYGHNVSVRWLVETSGLTLVHGDTNQLYGYPGFDFERISQTRDQFLVGKYPAMVQTVVLRKESQ
jgi:SAM-dependent methyltransferase